MKSNTRFKKNTKGIECLNCKQPISNVDNFCSNCGQVNDTKPLSVKQYITELLGGFFAFDTRTINTIKPLLFTPGKVTKEYINGERMKYVNPFQLYLHVSILFFLITGIFTSIDRYNDMLSTNKKSIKNEKKGAVSDFMKGWDSLPNKPSKNTVNTPEIKHINYKGTNKKENKITASSLWLKKYTYFFNSKTQDIGEALDSLGYKRTDKNIFFYKKLQELKKVTKGGEAGRSFLNSMISKSSLVMFFMLPLFTLFLSLVYIRKKNNYTEHLIFVFNVQTAFFILLLIGIILDKIFPNENDIYSLISLFLFLFYLYKAMRKFYNQGRVKTIIKYFILNFVYSLISFFGLITVAFLAFIM